MTSIQASMGAGAPGASEPIVTIEHGERRITILGTAHVSRASAEKVRELVKVGDIVTFNTPATSLMNDRFACKTMDDRACVGILLLTSMLILTAAAARKGQAAR